MARTAPPEEVFAAVTAEAGRLLDADSTSMSRYDPDGAHTLVGIWTSTGAAPSVPIGTWFGPGGHNTASLVFQTGRPARIDDFGKATGPTAEPGREMGTRASVAAPITVEGQLWGLVSVGSTRAPLPRGAEARLARFAELAATAIASAQARTDLRGFAEEQAALRRVATLVARAAPPGEVFAAVAAEAWRLLGAQRAAMSQYNADGVVTVVAFWSSIGPHIPVGTQWSLGGGDVQTLVFRTGEAARLDDYSDAWGPAADIARNAGVHAAVAVPIRVEGRLWGVMSIASTRGTPLPANIEVRLAGFTELAATAIANAEAQAALTASRARIVAAADQARRRIERDLHDGAQQRLVSLALQMRAAQALVPPELDELRAQLGRAVAEAAGALDELHEIARGIHPAVLTRGGLGPALKALVRRSMIPVDLDVHAQERLPEQVEVSAFYAVAEALTNAAKHARASAVSVEVEAAGDVLHVVVRDNGAGGADVTGGTGLVGLKDRVEALGGRIFLDSPHGEGTDLRIELPLAATNSGVASDWDGSE